MSTLDPKPLLLDLYSITTTPEDVIEGIHDIVKDVDMIHSDKGDLADGDSAIREFQIDTTNTTIDQYDSEHDMGDINQDNFLTEEHKVELAKTLEFNHNFLFLNSTYLNTLYSPTTIEDVLLFSVDHITQFRTSSKFTAAIFLDTPNLPITTTPTPLGFFFPHVKPKLRYRLEVLKSTLQTLTGSNIVFHLSMQRNKLKFPTNTVGLAKILSKSLSNPKYQGQFHRLFDLVARKLDTIIATTNSIGQSRRLIAYRIQLAGRLWTKGLAQYDSIHSGPLSAHSLKQVVDYHHFSAITRYGLTGFKIWLRYHPRSSYSKLYRGSIHPIK